MPELGEGINYSKLKKLVKKPSEIITQTILAAGPATPAMYLDKLLSLLDYLIKRKDHANWIKAATRLPAVNRSLIADMLSNIGNAAKIFPIDAISSS